MGFFPRCGLAARFSAIVFFSLSSLSLIIGCNSAITGGSGTNALSVSSSSDENANGPGANPGTEPAGIEFEVNLAAGEDVGLFRTDLPNNPGVTDFVIHGTLPIPPGVFPRADGKHPFFIEIADGVSVPAQTEIVSRYPNAYDNNGVAAGADVIELIARVPLSPNGTYKIRAGLHSYATAPSGLTPREILRRTNNLPPAVDTMLATGSAVKVNATDENGCLYETDVLDSSNAVHILRQGPAMHTIQTHAWMQPTGICTNGSPRPHLFGVQAFISTRDGDDVLTVDLLVHNGAFGGDHSAAPIGNIYFEKIGFDQPNGFVLINSINDTFFRNGNLVDAISNSDVDGPNHCYQGSHQAGQMHLLPAQGGIKRRLALAPAASLNVANTVLEKYGQAFATRGNSENDSPYFSWWNPATARYFTQAQRLPRFDRKPNAINTIRNKLISDYNDYKDARETGCKNRAPNSNSPLGVAVDLLGHALPLGAKYGGETSGIAISALHGLGALAAGSRIGVLLEELLFEMMEGRNARELYRTDGNPISPMEYDIPGPVITRKYRSFRLGPDAGNKNNFAFAPPGWKSKTGSQGVDPFYEYFDILEDWLSFPSSKRPGYQNDYVGLPQYDINGNFQGGNGNGFDRIDIQHLVRATRIPKALAWISNDPMGKLTVRRNGAISIGTLDYRHHEVKLPNTPAPIGGTFAMTVALQDVANLTASSDPTTPSNQALASFQRGGALYAVVGHPNQGMDMGRGYSWLIDAASSAYRMETLSRRDNYTNWFNVLTELLYGAYNKCAGTMNRRAAYKGYLNVAPNGDDYYWFQMYEEAFTHIAMTGLWKSFLQWADPAREAKIRTTIAAATKGMLTSGWANGRGNPWYAIAVSQPFPLSGNNNPIIPKASEENGNLYQFEVFTGTTNPMPACTGGVVAIGEDPPVRPNCTLVTGSCKSSQEVESGQPVSAPAYGYQATQGVGFNYLEFGAKMENVYQSGLSQSELAQAIFDEMKDDFSPNLIDKSQTSFDIGMWSLAEELSGNH